jgi:hypothetical protein
MLTIATRSVYFDLMLILLISFRLKGVRYYNLWVYSYKTPAFDPSPLFVSPPAITLMKTKIKRIAPRDFCKAFKIKSELHLLMSFKKACSLVFENNQVECFA